MNSDFIHTYSPNNVSNLTEQDIAAMQTLTDEQIRQLSERYPNHGVMAAYLILKDTSAKSQIYPASTWQNLYNLRVKNGMKRYVAFTFKQLFIKRNVTNIPVQPKVQDLTQQEIEGAEGIRRTNVGYAIHSKENIDVRDVEKATVVNEPSDENGEVPELTVPDKPKRTRKKITNNKKQ